MILEYCAVDSQSTIHISSCYVCRFLQAIASHHPSPLAQANSPSRPYQLFHIIAPFWTILSGSIASLLLTTVVPLCRLTLRTCHHSSRTIAGASLYLTVGRTHLAGLRSGSVSNASHTISLCVGKLLARKTFAQVLCSYKRWSSLMPYVSAY